MEISLKEKINIDETRVYFEELSLIGMSVREKGYELYTSSIHNSSALFRSSIADSKPDPKNKQSKNETIIDTIVTYR